MRLDTSALFTRPAKTLAVEIRPIASQHDLRACVALQRRTWGEDFAEVVPPSILKIGPRVGGVVAGAFDDGGSLLGFVFGLTGVERSVVVHWSHMLAVAPEAQNQGIGRRLKEYQRAEVARLGAKVIYWTYDPLVARNAHLNFNVLGVRATDYVENMYGESASPLHRGIGTDRLIVAWPVNDKELAARRNEIAQITQNGAAEMIRVEIPANIDDLQRADMNAAVGWRERSRKALREAFAGGYTIHGFQLDERRRRGYYLLARSRSGLSTPEARS